MNESPPDQKLMNKGTKIKELERIKFNLKKKRYKLNLPDDREIPVRFESRFENANLKKAVQVSSTEYNLLLTYDHNTTGHTQWFYFKITSKLKAGTEITFNILNLMKPDSLYNYGMLPCVFSEAQYKENCTGWHRACHNVSYKRNDILRNKAKPPPEGVKSESKLAQYYFFTLSFTYKLTHDNDEVSFAHAVPYTYSGHLLPFLDELAREEKYHDFLRIGTLWKTLARNDCKMMIITENIRTYRDCNEELKW
jgi:cytosolic carboxypeptidase protein 2/3